MHVFEILRRLYKGSSKVLKYFGNMRFNSATLDDFAEVINVKKHTEL